MIINLSGLQLINVKNFLFIVMLSFVGCCESVNSRMASIFVEQTKKQNNKKQDWSTTKRELFILADENTKAKGKGKNETIT